MSLRPLLFSTQSKTILLLSILVISNQLTMTSRNLRFQMSKHMQLDSLHVNLMEQTKQVVRFKT